jgi:GT2 family glycosyltransferase
MSLPLYSNPLVCVVVPTHNRKRYLLECLRSITASDYRNTEIFVIDDGSQDGTSEEVRRLFPSCKVLQGTGDLWWSGCMNLGIEAAMRHGARFILVLNDDVTIDKSSIAALVECATRHEGKSIVGSVIYSAQPPHAVWCAGGEMHWPWPGERMRTFVARDVDAGQEYATAWNPGMGTLIPVGVFSAVGLYEAAAMPQYLADADFALRAGKAGYSVLINPRSRLYNRVESTGGLKKTQRRLSIAEAIGVFLSPKSPDYLRARLLFIQRHCPKVWLIPALLIRYARLTAFLTKRVLVA